MIIILESKKDISHVFRTDTIIDGLIVCLLVNIIFLLVLSAILNIVADHIPSKMASKKDLDISLRK